jgi:hypothetical protein
MANVNSSFGVYNVPAQVITGTTETALKVPASGYSGYPSPVFAAAAGLCISAPGGVFDGHPFVVRMVGKAHTGASLTLTPKLYQVPNSIVAAGTQATVGNDHVVAAMAASSAFSGDGNFVLECVFLYDSTSGALNGQTSFAQINNVVNAVNSGTAGVCTATTQVTSVGTNDLWFMPTFTFGTANAANSVQIVEFAIDAA